MIRAFKDGLQLASQLSSARVRVGLKFFYKFRYGLIFDPTHLEPGSPELNSWWARL